MSHLDLIKVITQNPDEFEDFYNRLKELEVSCEVVANGEPHEIKGFIEMMKTSLINYQAAKFELVENSMSTSD